MDDPVFSPAFFWLWNAPLDAAALCAQLEDMRAHGLRNVCIHPFPKGFRPGSCPSGMDPDYLTPAFLDVFAAVVRRAGELGMHAWLYDEGGWPSGGACGLVAASDPDGRFAPRERTSADGSPRARPYGAAPARPSVVEPGATQRFLDLTHEAYASRLGGALGTTVRIAFTDEPGLPRDVPGRSLAWASDFDAEFRRRKGYDIAPFVPALLADADGADPALGRVRVDVQDVKADLFVERYLAPLRDRCRAHGLLSGGHLNNEDTPEAGERTGHGSILRSLRAMDVPGVDAIWRQLFPGKDVNPFPRYAASAAHQNGGRFALSESFAIYGDSLSPAERKWIVDAQLVRGINLFVFAYCAQSNARHWMTLLEPHAGPADPTWDFQPHFFRYVERTARFLSRGRPGAETAVLMNVRAFWAGKADREAAAAAHYAAAKALDEANCDYDFVEDRDLAAAEVLPDGRLRVGAMDYRAVALPSEAWMLPDALKTLARFEAAGGIVARGPAQFGKVPRTLRIAGDGARAIRVLSRVDGAQRIWFLMNEEMAEREVEIEFPDGGAIVRYDAETDVFEAVPVDPDGVLRHVFAPGEAALYATGDCSARRADFAPRNGASRKFDLTSGMDLLVYAAFCKSRRDEMENQDSRTKPHKTAQEGNENRIQSVSPARDRKFYPAFNAKGERIRKVYFRLRTDGGRTYYARVVDPKSGMETWQSSPDGSAAMAKALVADAERAVGAARVNAYSEALGAIRRRIDGWTIGRVLDEYPRAAEARRAVVGKPSAQTQKTQLGRARRILKGHEGESVERVPELVLAYAVRWNREHGGAPTVTAAAEAQQVRAVFAPWVLEACERAGMPRTELRWKEVAQPEFQYELPPLELRERTIAAGKEELAKGSDVGKAFLLEFFCAMSAQDSIRARWDWLRPDGTVPYARHKTTKSAAPRLSPDVAARWRELAAEADSPFVLPQRTEGQRLTFLMQGFARWMTGLGWRTKKKGHELRKLMCSIWYTTPGIGAEWTQAWSGDSLEVLQKHYARLLPEKAPPAPSV